MNIVVSVSSKNQERLQGFLDDIGGCHFDQGDKILVVKTGEGLEIPYTYVGNAKIERRQGKVGKRLYADIIKERNEFLQEIANEDTIIVNTDDDYSFNPYAFRVIKKVFLENPKVNYISLLKGGLPTPLTIKPVIMSGFTFFKVNSCMGGSIIAKWSIFKEDVDQYIEKYNSDNMFDIGFFNFINNKYGEDSVYMLFNFSLVQHCNLISSYLESKDERGKLAHMYGEHFDPRMNPFDVLDIQE